MQIIWHVVRLFNQVGLSLCLTNTKKIPLISESAERGGHPSQKVSEMKKGMSCVWRVAEGISESEVKKDSCFVKWVLLKVLGVTPRY